MENNRTDIEKKRYWQKVIREATRSKLSIREYCVSGKRGTSIAATEDPIRWGHGKQSNHPAVSCNRRSADANG